MPPGLLPINAEPAWYQAAEDYSVLRGLASTVDPQDTPSISPSHTFKTTLFTTLTDLHSAKRTSRMTLSRVKKKLNTSYTEIKRLTIHNKELQIALRKKEQEVEHLRCDICRTSIKGVVTACGHGFCQGCITRWLQYLEIDNEGFVEVDTQLEGPCPSCRRAVRSGAGLIKCFLSTGDSELDEERTENEMDGHGVDDDQAIEETQDD